MIVDLERVFSFKAAKAKAFGMLRILLLAAFTFIK
jgi:hypothetical protein